MPFSLPDLRQKVIQAPGGVISSNSSTSEPVNLDFLLKGFLGFELFKKKQQLEKAKQEAEKKKQEDTINAFTNVAKVLGFVRGDSDNSTNSVDSDKSTSPITVNDLPDPQMFSEFQVREMLKSSPGNEKFIFDALRKRKEAADLQRRKQIEAADLQRIEQNKIDNEQFLKNEKRIVKETRKRKTEKLNSIFQENVNSITLEDIKNYGRIYRKINPGATPKEATNNFNLLFPGVAAKIKTRFKVDTAKALAKAKRTMVFPFEKQNAINNVLGRKVGSTINTPRKLILAIGDGTITQEQADVIARKFKSINPTIFDFFGTGSQSNVDSSNVNRVIKENNLTLPK